MANKKLLARLDIKNDDVIKGLQLEGLRRIGSIFEVAQEREAELLDEIIVIDAVASLYGRQAVVEAIRSATAETFIPITAAGGVKCLDDAAQLFSAGADRVAVNSGAIKRPKILEEIARRFGAQSVVLSVEARRIGNSWHCFYNGGREDSGRKVRNWLAEVDPRFVGEVFLTSVDHDGLQRGPCYELLDELRDFTELPIIYSGGIESHNSAKGVLSRPQVSGIAIGAAFHYRRLSPTNLRSDLLEVGIDLARRDS